MISIDNLPVEGEHKKKQEKSTIQNIVFTQGQKIAIEGLSEFIDKPFDESKYIYGLVGPAGVGKTFILKYVIDNCKYTNSVIRLCTPTHKACRVFSQAMNNLPTYTFQSTFGFRPNMSLVDFDPNNPAFRPVAEPKLANIILLIVDEASMLPASVVKYINDTCRTKGIKIIYCGDDNQLPPPEEHKSTAFYVCNKMFHLTEIVRQGEDNPVSYLLDLIRNDIRLGTHNSINFIAKNRGKEFYNGQGEGYSIVDSHTFTEIVNNRFIDPSYHKNINKYKLIAYTNSKVSLWNNYIRNIIIDDAQHQFITKDDLMMSYVTLVDEFLSVIINNSEEYIINDIVNYTDATYGLKGYSIRFQMVNGGQITKPLFIINHLDKFTILKYIKTLDDLSRDAKMASGGTRAAKWKKYYDFKNNYLIAQNIIRNDKIVYSRDLDYGFALTSHKSQGSTYENVFVDATDIIFNSTGQPYGNIDETLRRLYVACSRTSNELIISYM